MLTISGLYFFFFFFNDTATTEIYTLSLHDALPILRVCSRCAPLGRAATGNSPARSFSATSFTTSCRIRARRSEEHTSELQSQSNLVCRLLLEKKKISFRRMTHATHSATSLA